MVSPVHNSNSGFFSSFNARHLGAEDVARSFVPNTKFRQLAALQNSLLVGPRGSGKTHLLKMLQPKALNAWEHPDADEVRRSVAYWGVFVPADEAWRQQVESRVEGLASDLQSRFRAAMFTAHVQRSVVDCFLQLTHDRPSQDRGYASVSLPAIKEVELCHVIAQSWMVQPRVHSLLGVRQALIDRCADLYEASDSQEAVRALLERCQTQAVQSALRGTNAFDSVVGRFGGRWCLLFDEIEIAPAEVQDLLFRALRSSDQSLLFKIALSPSTQAASVFREAVGPSAGNDFDEISLYSDAREAAAFCESLWENLAKGTTSEHLPPGVVLGHSTFSESEGAAPYAKGGRWQTSSSSLAKKDPSYRRFLQHYSIDPDNLASAPPKLRDAVVRKIAPIVGFRDFMFRLDEKRGTLRSHGKRKPSDLYSGWEALCLVSEGNPRWFTGMAKALLLGRAATVSRREISREAQFTVLAAASRKFLDYVSTIPTKHTIADDDAENGLKSLLAELTRRFREQLLSEDFSLDPVLSFEVDERVTPAVRDAVFDGLYSGAFVPVGDVDRQFAFSSDLAGQRLRVTYLVAPLELLPLRTGKARALSTLLLRNRSRTSKRQRGVTINTLPTQQEKLFNE